MPQCDKKGPFHHQQCFTFSLWLQMTIIFFSHFFFSFQFHFLLLAFDCQWWSIFCGKFFKIIPPWSNLLQCYLLFEGSIIYRVRTTETFPQLVETLEIVKIQNVAVGNMFWWGYKGSSYVGDISLIQRETGAVSWRIKSYRQSGIFVWTKETFLFLKKGT